MLVKFKAITVTLTRLGKYLFKLPYRNTDLYFKTGILPARLSIIRNKENSKLLAEELYLIALAIEEKPAKLAATIFADLTLTDPSLPKKDPKTQKKTLTKLGAFIEEKSRSQKAIERKTRITENRLSILANNPDSKILAEELYLISLAMEVAQDEIWYYLFSDLLLNDSDTQEELKLNLRSKTLK